MPMDPDTQGETAWRKSRRSMNNGACVEVATGSDAIVVRDSASQAAPMLWYSSRTWRSFLAQAKMGKFDVKTELTGTTVYGPL